MRPLKWSVLTFAKTMYPQHNHSDVLGMSVQVEFIFIFKFSEVIKENSYTILNDHLPKFLPSLSLVY